MNKEAVDNSDENKSNTGIVPNGLKAYWTQKNLRSIDGIPALRSAPYSDEKPQSCWQPPKKMAAPTMLNTLKAVVDEKLVGGLIAGVLISAVYFRLSK
jgi:hypothetical protein